MFDLFWISLNIKNLILFINTMIAIKLDIINFINHLLIIPSHLFLINIILITLPAIIFFITIHLFKIIIKQIIFLIIFNQYNFINKY